MVPFVLEEGDVVVIDAHRVLWGQVPSCASVTSVVQGSLPVAVQGSLPPLPFFSFFLPSQSLLPHLHARSLRRDEMSGSDEM